MALQFQPPPDWLIQEYVNRKQPAEIMNEGVGNAIDTYARLKQQQALTDLAKQKLAAEQAKMGAEGRVNFFKYGDPTGLPPEAQSALSNPMQGPPTAQGDLPGGGNHIVDAFEQFRRQFPQGIEGAKAMKERSGASGNPKTLDAILAKSVEDGTMTLDQALAKQATQRGSIAESVDTAKNDVKIRKERPKAEASLQNSLREYENMINEAKAIRDDPSVGTATGMTSFMGSVPGTGAKNVAARLETLKAKTLLNVLSSLKELSTTGASGFGQLSNYEGEGIRNSISTLDRSLGTKDFKASIDRFINEMDRRKGVLADTFNKTYGGASQQNGDPLGIR